MASIAAGRKEFTFGLGIGPTLVELEWQRRPRSQFAWMTQQKPVFGPTLNAPGPLRRGALGIDPSALRPGVLPQEVNCGSPFFMVPLVSRAAVDQAVRRHPRRRGDVRGREDHAPRALHLLDRARRRRRDRATAA